MWLACVDSNNDHFHGVIFWPTKFVCGRYVRARCWGEAAVVVEWFNQIIKHSETTGPPPPIVWIPIGGAQQQTKVKNLINNFEEGFVVIA